ncbi:MAG: hypothetical protein WD844_16255 [Thermoleophilaceae bacterium]
MARKRGKGETVLGARVVRELEVDRDLLTTGGSCPWLAFGRKAPVARASGDSELLYCMHPDRRDDCFRVALATVLQVPLEQLPDVRLDARLTAGDDPEAINDESWARLELFLRKRGLRFGVHRDLPEPGGWGPTAHAVFDCQRWIGVVEVDQEQMDAQADFIPAAAAARSGAGSNFLDHCLVMAWDRVYFDPAISVKPPTVGDVRIRVRQWNESDIAYGISVERDNDDEREV